MITIPNEVATIFIVIVILEKDSLHYDYGFSQ